MNTETMQRTIHDGRKIKRVREILGVKQEALAITLGINQQKMSFMEGKEKIDDEQFNEIAKALNIPVEALKKFSEEAATNIIANNFSDHSILNGVNFYPTFNPIDKIVELYERLVETEKTKVQILEKQLAEKK